MANGLEAFETSWNAAISGFKIAFEDSDLTPAGFVWRDMGLLDLSDNSYDDSFAYTLPDSSPLAVITVVTVIGAAASNPNIWIQYEDSAGTIHNITIQVTPGMQEFTSISIPLVGTAGITDLTIMSTNIAASGSIQLWSPESTAEKFNPTSGFSTVWSPATPGL